MTKDELIEKYCDSELYADYVMENHDPEEYVICNGDTLLEAMNNLYLFEEFVNHYEL